MYRDVKKANECMKFHDEYKMNCNHGLSGRDESGQYHNACFNVGCPRHALNY